MDALKAQLQRSALLPDKAHAITISDAGFSLYLDEFEQFLDRQESGFVSVIGSVGSGKTSLLDRFTLCANARDWAVAPMDSWDWQQMAERPTLLILDNVSHQQTSHLLKDLQGFIEAETSPYPLVIAFAVRSAELKQMPDLRPLLEKAAMNCRLSSLTRSQVAAEMRGVLGEDEYAPDLFDLLVKSTAGHPLMVRLILEALKECPCKSDTKAIHKMVAGVQGQMCELVWKPLLAGLSEGDFAFLAAMAQDDEPSRMQNISTRLGKTPQYAGVYRNRLVAAEIIRAASYGKVTFVNPLVRTYVRQLVGTRHAEEF